MKYKVLLLCCLGIAGAEINGVAYAADTHLKVKLTSGTCDVALDPVTLGLGDNISPSDLNEGGHWSTPHSFAVKLSNCGVGNSAKLTVTGDVINQSDPIQRRMFRDAAHSTSVNFGVLVFSKQPTEQGQWHDVLDPTSNTNNGVAVDLTQLANRGMTVPFWAAVTCGSTALCNDSSTRSGTLQASVTFTFNYS
ncbi:TPA: type 1 fimbrial protein [Serratia marcescens]|nr:type 1 fimbrial protein [Serratia marcescens]